MRLGMVEILREHKQQRFTVTPSCLRCGRKTMNWLAEDGMWYCPECGVHTDMRQKRWYTVDVEGRMRRIPMQKGPDVAPWPPTVETLCALVETHSDAELAKIFGVSRESVRKLRYRAGYRFLRGKGGRPPMRRR